ncbi:selenide, water dikinase SelD [Sanyastnella coralliicola]|uniref:selenide, water dikinase SelD n=1 Tax=Sanyastnella coralliicola TaxID=3069118 RepID=UPI0027B8E38B|nr:selenide, water dikinase SelD [Longitalea sp. SCSIO 12813]
MEVKLTQYSHGAGCGCKLSPAVLDDILSKVDRSQHFPGLLVGNSSKDDAAVHDLGNGQAVVSTTDFFMPIVDDAADFGRIAATNAISDIYAMGGTPMMAIAILGWPIDKLSTEVAGQVLEGGREVCSAAGIPLAGGHSIDSPEPIFGLAVTGIVGVDQLKQNDKAKEGDILFLTKGLGVGMITTAQKRSLASDEHVEAAVNSMKTLNKIGAELGKVDGVNAMTDVTGFGLLGHLSELTTAAGLKAEINFASIPTVLDRESLLHYHTQGAIPGGTKRNFASYGHYVEANEGFERDLLCDPQTSGGLLVSCDPSSANQVAALLQQHGLHHEAIGKMVAGEAGKISVIA